MTEVTRAGRIWRIGMYAWCGVMVAGGPGFLAFDLLLDANVWAGVLIGAVLSVVLVPLGYVLASDVRRTARRMRRLDTAGVPAVAEVLSVTRSSRDDGPRVELNLWITAPGVAPFEVLHLHDGADELQVGSTLPAVVDGGERLYAVG